MYVEEIKKKQGSKIYKTVLIRESYRDNGKVKHITVANISKLPVEHIRQLRASLRGDTCDFKVSCYSPNVSINLEFIVTLQQHSNYVHFSLLQ